MIKHEEIQKLYNLCYRLTGDIGLTEKLCVKTIVKIKEEKIELQNNEDAFIRLAKKAIQFLLQRKSSSLTGKAAPDDHAPKMQKALNNLPLKERIVIVLHDTYAFSYFQIASLFPGEDVRELSKEGRKKLALMLQA